MGQQVPPSTVSPQEINVITVVAVKTNAATIAGKISGIEMEMDARFWLNLFNRMSLQESLEVFPGCHNLPVYVLSLHLGNHWRLLDM